MNELVTVDHLPILEALPERKDFLRLDGKAGMNRAQQADCQIRANNDWEAIQCWLSEYKHKATTHSVYQRDAERLLLWCVFRHQKPLSSLDRDDLEMYFSFLQNPQPRERWCGRRGGMHNKRGSTHWRPFVGPLSTSSIRTSISAIRSLFNYLMAAQYLKFNPFSVMRKPKIMARQQRQEYSLSLHERILSDDEWLAMLSTLDAMPEDSTFKKDSKIRLRFLVAVLFFLGLRISELANSTWRNFKKINGKWWFFVVGKGDKAAKIPVNDELLEEIASYRRHLKLIEATPQPHEDYPLVVNWRSNKGLSIRAMHTMLKQLGIETSKRFPDNPDKQEKLKRFSPHWLRHLSASMQDRVGISFKHVRENLRHEKDDTTRQYVHAFDDDRHDDMSKLTLKSIGDGVSQEVSDE